MKIFDVQILEIEPWTHRLNAANSASRSMESAHVAAIAKRRGAQVPSIRYTAKRISTTSTIVVHSVLRMLCSATKSYISALIAGKPVIANSSSVG